MEIPVVVPGFQAQRITVEPAGFWSGPRLLANGTRVEKTKGKYTVPNDAGQDVAFELKTNFFDPVPRLLVAGEAIALARPLAWYEYAWMGLPFILVFSGGALGAGFGTAAIYTSARIFRSDRGNGAKYGLSGLVTFGAFAAFIVLAVVLQLLLRPT